VEASYKAKFESKKTKTIQESTLSEADKAIIDAEFAEYVDRQIQPDARGMIEIEEMGNFHGKLSRCGLIIRNAAFNADFVAKRRQLLKDGKVQEYEALVTEGENKIRLKSSDLQKYALGKSGIPPQIFGQTM
jgi:hypothetical protein